MTAPAADVETSTPDAPGSDSAPETVPNTTQVNPEIPTDTGLVDEDENSQATGEPEADFASSRDHAHEAYEADLAERQANPDEPVIRAADPSIGGEAFL